jgi:hypothetical protein
MFSTHTAIRDPRHWRDRAEEARLVSLGVHDEPSREALLRIAESYERLAKRAEHVRGSGSAT